MYTNYRPHPSHQEATFAEARATLDPLVAATKPGERIRVSLALPVLAWAVNREWVRWVGGDCYFTGRAYVTAPGWAHGQGGWVKQADCEACAD